MFLGYLKLGFHDYDDVFDRFLYFSPEILITALIMLNEIRLKLYGLYYVIENDIETINDAVQRHLSHGDLKQVYFKKKQNANMDLARSFKSQSN